MSNIKIGQQHHEEDNTGRICPHCAKSRHMEWQQANPDKKIRVGDFCKIAFSEGENTEHMWVLVTETLGNWLFEGTLNNTPQVIRNLQPLQKVYFHFPEIEEHVAKPIFE